jgi:hypothetical protein
MSKATPLDQLSSPSNDRDIVQDVLNDLDGEMGGDQEVDYDQMSNQHQDRYRQYQHDPSQVAQYNQQQLDNAPPQDEHRNMCFQEPTWAEWIWEHMKSPLLFVLLFVVLNLAAVRAPLDKYLPTNDWQKVYSLGIRAVVGAIIFYILRMFVMPLI